jgi:hypothetical protein
MKLKWNAKVAVIPNVVYDFLDDGQAQPQQFENNAQNL